MADQPTAKRRIPTWIKVAYTLFVFVLIPVYWCYRSPTEFLWFSDIALLIGVAALWLESRLLASMMAVGVLAPELIWNASFFARLLTGYGFLGFTEYMFTPETPLIFRALSLFHIALPPLMLWMLRRLGYDRRAFAVQAALSWIILPVTRLLTSEASNVNWVYRFPNGKQAGSPLIHVALLMALYPLLVCLPTHLALRRMFRSRPGTS